MEGQEQLVNALQQYLNAKDNSQLIPIFQGLIANKSQLRISFSYKCAFHQFMHPEDRPESSLFIPREQMHELNCQFNHMSCHQCAMTHFRRIFFESGFNSQIFCPICLMSGVQELVPLPISLQFIQQILSLEEIQQLQSRAS